MALAVAADSPCDCRFTHEPDFGMAVRFRFGLSAAAGGEFKSRAPFHFVLYRCDGRWGLRDAARRYYALYPRAFEKRVRREGLWLFGSIPKWLPDPENYAFHEGGIQHRAYGDRHTIATCPYIIPGQREITRLAELPKSERDALETLKEWVPQKPGRERGWGANMKQIIENCRLNDRDGTPRLLIRKTTWGGNSVTFPLNTNPKLYGDTPRPTIAATLLDTVRRWLREAPTIDGIYVDSLGLWGNFFNHRREHMAYTQTPLSSNPASDTPALSNQYALLEFLWSLRDLLHAEGKILFANGLHPTRRFHCFAVDVMGVEGSTALEQKRVMAAQKPFLLLIYNIHTDPVAMAAAYQRCTFYGIYPSFGNTAVFKKPEDYAAVATLNNRYVPVLRSITGAGWKPVTQARCDDANVWLERWGPDAEGVPWLTVYNAGKTDIGARIVVDAKALGIGRSAITVTDVLNGESWHPESAAGQFSLSLRMTSATVRVLKIVSD